MTSSKTNNAVFSTAFPSIAEFLDYFNGEGIYQSGGNPFHFTLKGLNDEDDKTEVYLETIYYLLYSRYGDTQIGGAINYFRMKVFSKIFAYGPSFIMKLSIQDKIRNLSENDIVKGSVQIHNHASNDATSPGTQDLEELGYIDDQTTFNIKKNKISAYYDFADSFDDNLISVFLDRFKNLFKKTQIRHIINCHINEED